MHGRVFVCLVLSLWLGGCRAAPIVIPGVVAPSDCPESSAVGDAVFLVGDAGKPKLPQDDADTRLVDPLLRSLRSDVDAWVGRLGPEHVLVVFLGDNVYPRGLVPPGESARAHGERVLEAQIAAAGSARAIFTAGNHDWDMEGAKGWEHIREQNAFLAARGERVSMLPAGGCAGPERVDLGRRLRLVFIDPIGFSHAAEDPARHAAACPQSNAVEAFLELADEFDAPDGRHVVLALHHPLITAGAHGGNFTWKQHVFPLTDFVPWLWLPLPVIGSAYPLSRQLGVTGTDATSQQYDRWIRGIYRATRPRVPIVFAGGHEHSLQVHRDSVGTYYIVSGSGSKLSRVEPLETAMFSLSAPGYMRLDSHTDGALGLSVISLLDGETPEQVFRHCLAEGPPEPRKRRR